jgi:DNA replication protein
MAFEALLTDDLVRIAAAGGGFRLQAGARTTDDLVRIASAGSRHNARLIFVGLGARTTDDIVRISAAGKGSVFFE